MPTRDVSHVTSTMTQHTLNYYVAPLHNQTVQSGVDLPLLFLFFRALILSIIKTNLAKCACVKFEFCQKHTNVF